VKEEEEEEFERSYHNLYKSHSKLVNGLEKLMKVLSNIERTVDLNQNVEAKVVCFECKELTQLHSVLSKHFMFYVTKFYRRIFFSKLKNLDVPSLEYSTQTITELNNMEHNAYSG
jgi:hypothetical protein